MKNLLLCGLVIIVVQITFGQERYRNKPWKKYSKNHSNIILNTNGELKKFPQYFNSKKDSLTVTIIESSIELQKEYSKAVADKLKFEFIYSVKNEMDTNVVEIKKKNSIKLSWIHSNSKQITFQIIENNGKPDELLRIIDDENQTLNEKFIKHIDLRIALKDSVQMAEAIGEDLMMKENKLNALNKLIESGNVLFSELNLINKEDSLLKAQIDSYTKRLKSLNNHIKARKNSIALFERYYLTKQTIIYHGILYISTEDTARFMRNHYANNGFKEASKERTKYYEQEEVSYLIHKFSGDLVKFKLVTIGEEIKNHKPNWVTEATIVIDELSEISSLDVSGLIEKHTAKGLDYKEFLKDIIEKNRNNPKTLGKSIELKEEKRDFELPATVSYTINEYKSKDKIKSTYTFNKAYKTFTLNRFQVQGGINYSILNSDRVELDPSGTNLNPKLRKEKFQFMAGLKVYPWKSEIEDVRFMSLTKHRISVIGGMAIPSPLENLYLGLGYDFLPGLNVNASCLWYRYEQYDIKNGVVEDTQKRYRPTLSIGLGVDASIFIKTIKLLGK